MRAIGLDVHKHFAEVAVVQPGQGIVSRERLPVTPASLRQFAARLGPADHVVLEASFNTWAVAELLGKHAGRVIVSNPMKTRAIASAKVKTDQVDAGILAQLLAADFIPPVWVPDQATRELRRMVSEHRGLVVQRSQLRNRIHAIVNRNLIECPYTDTFGRAGLRWLVQLRLPAAERREVDRLLRLLSALGREIDGLEMELAQARLQDAGLRHLVSVPGIGLLTAIALLAVVGDVKRFARPNRLIGYLGLDPRVRQSGDRPAYTGHISRQGQAHARGLLLEAAHSAVRVPGPLRAFYERVRARRGPQIALVAVARKLAVLAWHLLSKDTDYQWVRPSLKAQKWRQVELRAGLPKGTVHGVWSRTNRKQEEAVLQQAETAYRSLVAARRQQRDAAAPMRKRLEGQRPDARRRSHPHPPLFSRGSTASAPSIVPQLPEDTECELDFFIREARLAWAGEPGPPPQAREGELCRMTALTRTLRAHALRFPETREDFPWEDDRVIKVKKKIFVFLGDRSIGVKLTHSNQAALGLPFVTPMAYGLGRSGWVTVDLSKSRKPAIDLLKAWIDESYRAVAPKTLVARLTS